MTGHGRALVPAAVDRAIEQAVTASSATFATLVRSVIDQHGRPLGIKYMPPKYGALYTGAQTRLRISDRVGFTWGTGVYIAPLCYPVTTALYGRAGVVCWFDPTGWRVLDCTDPTLYVDWVSSQPTFQHILTTVHSDYHNHLLRNLFREQYRIDCILFHPDESDAQKAYTKDTDVWMTVGEFTAAGTLLEKADSALFHDARLVVLLEEEFETDDPALTRSPLLQLTPNWTPTNTLVADIVRNYDAGRAYTRLSA